MMYFRRKITRTRAEARSIAPETIDGIVRMNGPYLQSVLLNCGVRDPDVEDQLQRVWETLRNANQVRGSLKVWLVRVAVNRAGNYHLERRALKRSMVTALHENRDHDSDEELIEAYRDPNSNPEELLIGTETARVVDDLDPQLRAVMTAHIAGATTEEISQSLQIPEGTVHSRLRRARVQIDAALARNNAPRVHRACR
jgi:RNA polymerase sigma factor (sigma-70 family)